MMLINYNFFGIIDTISDLNLVLLSGLVGIFVFFLLTSIALLIKRIRSKGKSHIILFILCLLFIAFYVAIIYFKVSDTFLYSKISLLAKLFAAFDNAWFYALLIATFLPMCVCAALLIFKGAEGKGSYENVKDSGEGESDGANKNPVISGKYRSYFAKFEENDDLVDPAMPSKDVFKEFGNHGGDVPACVDRLANKILDEQSTEEQPNEENS